jgi:SAM-dependent methyltransferase
VQENPGKSGESTRWERNAAHWRSVLGSDNLARETTPEAFRREVELFATPDVRRAVALLARTTDSVTVDIGGGNALAAVLLARAGCRVAVLDLSLPRLLAARRLCGPLVPPGSVDFVCAAAEELPLREACASGVFSKSVLIHTELARAAGEIERVLSPDGIGVFIEPTPSNPLVRVYRALLAPREWADITTYFDREQWLVLRRAFRGRHRAWRGWYLTGFLATFFQFALPRPRLQRAAFALLGMIDRALVRTVPRLGAFSWFGMLVVQPRRGERRRRTRAASSPPAPRR